MRLGDTAPDFEPESTTGTIRFHEWIGNEWCLLFSHGLQRESAEIHAVLRDHGPLQEGSGPSMLSMFRGSCSEVSVPDSLPVSARTGGPSGNYDCSNVQMVIFEP